MKLLKIKRYIIGGIIGLILGITSYSDAGSFTGFTSMTQTWFNAIKTKLDGSYSSGKICTSDSAGQIQCLNNIPINIGGSCTSGKHVSGLNSNLVPTCLSFTRTKPCVGIVVNAYRNTASSIIQTWNGSSWLPTQTGIYSTTASTTSCNYVCNPGYAWNGSSCVAPLALSVSSAFIDGDLRTLNCKVAFNLGIPTVSAEENCQHGTSGWVSKTGYDLVVSEGRNRSPTRRCILSGGYLKAYTQSGNSFSQVRVY